MKIEKINDNQIKCTLYKSDLAARQLKMTELAYGTDKTRGLLKDMMEQASDECGFELNENPLMIEATPISMDCIVLMITRMDDPEELDPAFTELSNMIDLLQEGDTIPAEGNTAFGAEVAPPSRMMFSFGRLDDVINLAKQTSSFYAGENSLYKSPEEGRYYLVLEKSSHDTKEFASVCSAALEYGLRESLSLARKAYIDENYEPIAKFDALQNLADI